VKSRSHPSGRARFSRLTSSQLSYNEHRLGRTHRNEMAYALHKRVTTSSGVEGDTQANLTSAKKQVPASDEHGNSGSFRVVHQLDDAQKENAKTAW